MMGLFNNLSSKTKTTEFLSLILCYVTVLYKKLLKFNSVISVELILVV
jgi:hypothetical protein